MLEPAVTLTNALLALECWGFALALRRLPSPPHGVLTWYTALFALLGLGAALGGVTHGFLPDSRAVWTGNMLALGGAGAATAMIAGRIALSPARQRPFALVIAALALAYAALVLFVTQDFLVALAAAVPPVIFLIAAQIALYRRSAASGVLWGVAGLVLNLVGGVQQQLQIGLDPVWFNHNAVFHLIQMVAFWLIYRGARPAAAAL